MEFSHLKQLKSEFKQNAFHVTVGIWKA